MGDTTIEWTHIPGFRGRTWNATRGCSRISPGCEHCYAESIAERFAGPGLQFEGFARERKDGGGWTRKLALIDAKVDDPLAWREPSAIFTNSTSDLFHRGLPDSAIDRVFAAMLLSPQHRYLTLTKRADRMREYLTGDGLYARVLAAASEFRRKRPKLAQIGISDPRTMPASWIWWGVSVESQRYADERIPELLACPAAVRFVSYEPALGPVDFSRWLVESATPGHCVSIDGDWWHDPGRCVGAPVNCDGKCCSPRLDWVIVGGESGPGARPFDLRWARSLIALCREARTPVFVKQLGANPMEVTATGTAWDPCLIDRKGGDMREWPADLRVRMFPGDTWQEVAAHG